jgi:hypothetical protein
MDTHTLTSNEIRFAILLPTFERTDDEERERIRRQWGEENVPWMMQMYHDSRIQYEAELAVAMEEV